MGETWAAAEATAGVLIVTYTIATHFDDNVGGIELFNNNTKHFKTSKSYLKKKYIF